MSNFRTKLLGLAAVATAFAGLSYGQAITGCATATAAGEPSNPSLRAEGETELVADITVTCNITAATSGTLVISVSPLVITSKAFTNAGVPSNEATLTINGAGPIQGTVSGSSVSFAIANIPDVGGTVAFSVYNIRVNATTATNPQVVETGIISYAATSGTSNASINPTPFDVGYVLPSLGGTALPTGVFATGYTACAGNPVSTASPAPPTASFTLAINELAPGSFFKGAGVAPLGEGGYPAGQDAGLNAAIGTANTATELQVTIGNLPAGSTVYLLGSVVAPAGGGANSTTLTATGSPVGGSGGLANYVAVTPVGGVATAVYVASTTGTGAAGAQIFSVPVVVSFPANSAAQTPITALVTYAPTGTLTGPASAVPTFAASSATPINTSTIINCQTTLLFPYVTNATGFETGIAVVNTTTDNLGTIPGKPSAASPTTGTCTLNFYGNAAQPTATVTPTLGAYSTSAPTVVPIYANILTSMIGSSGFSGYAIAACNFLEAHGFAFITDTTGTFSGTEGYLATVIPATRNENVPEASSLSLNLTLTGTIGGGGTTLAGTAAGTASGTLVTGGVGQ